MPSNNMENENGEEVILNTSEETVELKTTESSEEVTEQEDEFDWKAEALKMKEIAENQRIRAEKAEKAKKEVKTETVKESGDTTEDLYALIEAKVPREDISDVREYAKFKGISIAEALKTGAVRSILAEKEEQRTVSNATNTGGSKRSSGKLSDDTLLANANKGQLPESQADIDRLVRLKTFGR